VPSTGSSFATQWPRRWVVSAGASAAYLLSRDEARRIAANIAELSELLGGARSNVPTCDTFATRFNFLNNSLDCLESGKNAPAQRRFRSEA
jgi:hypothetical protein